MKENVRDSGVGGLMRQLAAEKKKTVLALCLIVLMAVMWVKVLGGKGPKTAAAALIVEEAATVM